LGTNSPFVLWSRKTKENLPCIGWPHDLPYASRILATSPGFKRTNPQVSPCLCCYFILKSFTDLVKVKAIPVTGRRGS
jgi:hypothetical protein